MYYKIFMNRSRVSGPILLWWCTICVNAEAYLELCLNRNQNQNHNCAPEMLPVSLNIIGLLREKFIRWFEPRLIPWFSTVLKLMKSFAGANSAAKSISNCWSGRLSFPPPMRLFGMTAIICFLMVFLLAFSTIYMYKM